jgi:hypothetical protein
MTYTPTTIAARLTLLDALQALEAQRDALVLVGAQAVYLHTGAADVSIATQTKDINVAVIPTQLHDNPTLEDAMRSAGFHHDVTEHQPGALAGRHSGRAAGAGGVTHRRRPARRADPAALQARSSNRARPRGRRRGLRHPHDQRAR